MSAGDIKGAAEHIKRTVSDDIQPDSLNTSLAHILLLAGDWREINSLLLKDTNTLSTSGWLNSIYTQRPVNRENEPIPWYSYAAIDFLDTVVKDTWSVFEWGCGNSTRWWASKVRSVISVEDDAQWYQEISAGVPSNSTIHHRVGKDYYEHILSYPDRYFDTIVIDGSHRNEAAKNCTTKVKETGIIIFDNSDNADFDESQAHLIDCGFFRVDFWSLLPSYLYKNCTSIYFMDPEILRIKVLPSAHISSVGISCQQALNRFRKE